MSTPTIITARELADLARVSESQVRHLAARDTIPGAFRIGKKWLFHADLAIPHLMPRRIPAPCPARPESVSTRPAPEHGVSDGANTDGNAKKADTRPAAKPRTRRTPSNNAFAAAFPEYKHLTR